MGWVKTVPRAHECKRPEPSRRKGLGSVWRCRRCGKRYELIESEYRTKGVYETHAWTYQEVTP